MDLLCKWAWLGAECLLNDENGSMFAGIDKSRIAVVLATSKGCLDVDKRYRQTVDGIPSPALFVYTLSNIMLGEICIRHGFKGEQMCLVSERFDAEEIGFWATDLLERRNMEACLCGWVDATGEQAYVCMYWVSKKQGVRFSPEVLEHFYNS